jgi:two-component system cell cycle sensor histidine kinase/response regulator CckA
MASPRPLPDGTSRAARRLADAWNEAELPLALAHGAALLVEISGARVNALFVLGDEGIAAEAWFPEANSRDLKQRVRYQRAALVGPHTDPRDAAAPGVSVLRRPVPSAAPGQERPGVTLVWVRDGEGAATDDAESVLEVLAWKIAATYELASHGARQEQYERWFKTLDAQLRILDRERQKFAAVANQSDTYAFVTDHSRTIRWINKAMAQIVGGDADSGWTGRACNDLCVRIGLKGAAETCDECPVRRAYATNSTVHRELEDAPGGRELYLTALPIKGPDGRALEVLSQIQDLTNLGVVRRAKEQLETVIAGAPIVLFAVDKDGLFTLSEGKGLEALGRVPGQTIGQSIFDLYREVPVVGQNIRRALAGETLTDVVDVGNLSFETYYGPLRDPDGSIQGVIGVGTDVTERRRAERALQESEEKLRHAQRLEAVGSLAGGVAHDFNNLLTAMFGHLKFLRERAGSDAKLHGEVDAIEHAAKRAATLTRQLLAFSRKQVLKLRVVDLNGVLRDMEPMLRRLVREDIDLVVLTDSARPWIRADVGQMEQVVINLVVNAGDAIPREGRIILRTVDVDQAGMEVPGIRPEGALDPSPHGACVGLVVQDNGSGMDADTQARAFEPFFTTKPVGEGTGLGLSTVYGIVKQSEGEVFLTSAPGAGTTFTLYFPCTEAPSAAEPDRVPVPSLVPGNETILLVEDEAMVRELFRDVLEAAGYHVLEAKNGMEALEIVARYREPIALMVTDVVMPGMAGGELVRRMAQVRPEVKVLYVSGYNDDVLVRRGVIDAGVSFLQKPCMPDELSRVVRAILG